MTRCYIIFQIEITKHTFCLTIYHLFTIFSFYERNVDFYDIKLLHKMNVIHCNFEADASELKQIVSCIFIYGDEYIIDIVVDDFNL